MRGTFFVVTSLVARDPAHRVARGEDGAQRRYLVWPEVRALAAAGMEIGSHGEHHLRMADLDRAQVLGELTRSKQTLDGVLGISTEVLAYPYNSVRRWIVPLARESGYRAAVAGMAHGNADRFTLYRMGVYRGTTADQVLAQLTNLRAALEGAITLPPDAGSGSEEAAENGAEGDAGATVIDLRPAEAAER